MRNPKPTLITTVKDADVLSGRGGKTNKHSGNRIYRGIVKENRKLYQEMKSNSHKQLLAESIIATVHQRGGRFLKRVGKDTNTWIELGRDEAIIKTTQALREIPSGTSSRAMNVERMLEQKRMNRSSSSTFGSTTSCSESEDSRKVSFTSVPVPMHISSAHRLSVESAYDSVASVAKHHSKQQRPSTESNGDMLSDEELDSLINDNEAYDTIVSLLDKQSTH